MEKLRIANSHLKSACDDYERDFRAQIAKLDDEERALAERWNELNKKKLAVAEASGDVAAADDDFVEVNAGGAIVAARRSTLTLLKATRMEALFSGRWDRKLQQDNYGRIFLDVNPECFRAIVDYLHEAAISPEDDPPNPPCVGDEHKHILRQQLELFGLLDRMPPGMPASNIISKVNEVSQLHDWLEEEDSDGDFGLLYSSSRDGLSDEAFHSKCDHQGCTLAVFKTTDGYIVGGYSNASWGMSGGWALSTKTFLFVLSGCDSRHFCKMKPRKDGNSDKSVYHSTNGPMFGSSGLGCCDLIMQGSCLHLKLGNAFEASQLEQLNADGGSERHCIEEAEVFQVSGESSWANCGRTSGVLARPEVPKEKIVKRFSEGINEAINAKQESLLHFDAEILHLEESFRDECHFVSTIAGGDARDIVTLNVSGTVMVTQRSTLCTVEDSVLAQQFDDSKWTEQGCGNLRVADWTPDDVGAWAAKIDGIPDDVSGIFKDNEITGRELFALGVAGLKMVGIKRAGTVCILLEGIKKLRNEAFIEHSAYCFGKILDYLRLKQLHSRGLVGEPALPIVCKSQRNRFEKVVRYYFPGDSGSFLLRSFCVDSSDQDSDY